MAKKEWDYTFKIILIGSQGVGKIDLMSHFAGQDQMNNSAIGVDFKLEGIELDGKKIKLQIWDTAGQEKFQTISSSYFRGAKGIMFVYDVTNRKSLEDLALWIEHAAEQAKKTERIILGNNCESESARQVSKTEGEELAKKHGMRIFETSTKASLNVEKAFLTLAREIKEKMDRTEKNSL
ncbi:ras-related protein Rab-10 isoform X1 [Callorhinchus milii]|uniref:Ras-related protein Rab-10 n=1 Tax=Callorhinchus milii TaxID=7868 RepID=V9LFA7_CALMI|nr:ras-related protein Rab-10 isoform X1 [Callorhinchus milii]